MEAPLQDNENEDDILDAERRILLPLPSPGSQKMYLANLRRFLSWAQGRIDNGFLHESYHTFDVNLIRETSDLKDLEFPLTSTFSERFSNAISLH
jgi:hypothetical protein